MATRSRKTAKTETQENAIDNAAPANEVDETVVNQENPGTIAEDRSEDTEKSKDDEVAKMALAMDVDPTVENQMNPGINMVDRQPDRILVDDDAGVTYDLSKPYPELVDKESEERQQEKAYIRQNEGALNAADWREESDAKLVELEFVESGLTAMRQVWVKGQVLRVREEDMEDWMQLSSSEQEERYGKVFFEKR